MKPHQRQTTAKRRWPAQSPSRWLLGCLLIASLVCCASIEPDDGELTSYAPNFSAPTAAQVNTGGTGGQAATNPAGNETTTSPPSTPTQGSSTTPNSGSSTTPTQVTPQTPTALGFVGTPALGFSLQSTDIPSLCLASKGSSIAKGNSYALTACTTNANQLFYWAQGTLAQSANLCLTGSWADSGTLGVDVCPNLSSIYTGQYSIGTYPSIWLLSSDTNSLYTNAGGSSSGTYVVGPTNSVSAGDRLQMKSLSSSSSVFAHLVATTKFAGAVRIFLTDSSDVRCLTEKSGTAVLATCQLGLASQAWGMRNHGFTSASGLCLAADSAVAGSSTSLKSCDSTNALQTWFLAGGLVALSTPYTYVSSQSLALDMNASISADRPVLSLMPSTKALWSIGAQNYH